MGSLFKKINQKVLLMVLPALLAVACHKKDYPCPGLGQSNEADISMFDENGKLKSDGKNSRINKSNGLIKKKKDKRLNAPRKTHI